MIDNHMSIGSNSRLFNVEQLPSFEKNNSTYLLSFENDLIQEDSFSTDTPYLVSIFQSMESVMTYLSLKCNESGHPNIQRFLERVPVYIYPLKAGKRLKIIGH